MKKFTVQVVLRVMSFMVQVMSFVVQVKWLVDGWLVYGFQIGVLDVFRQSRRSTANLHPLLYVAVGFFCLPVLAHASMHVSIDCAL